MKNKNFVQPAHHSPRSAIHGRWAVLALIAICCTGCLQTLGITRGPGSTHYDINVKQYIKGDAMHAKTDAKRDGTELETTGGGNINITIVPIGDSVVETDDDNSAAKGSTAETTPTVKVTP
jgi:hypothetical protein